MNNEKSRESPLAVLFPELRFAGAADNFLAACNPGNVLGTLHYRRVSQVSIVPLAMNDGGLSVGKDGNFVITVDDSLPLEIQARVLGCELGHTFHHNLTQQPPADYLTEDLRDLAGKFCDRFGERWLKKVTLKAVVECLEKEEEKVARRHAHAQS